MAEAVRQEVFSRDIASGAIYVKCSDAAVAYSLRIEEKDSAFIADYDRSGGVRGLEFLAARKNTDEYYRDLATTRSKGPDSSSPREKRLP